MLDLSLSVKTSEFRDNDRGSGDADRAFQGVRLVVLSRDRYTCQGCGLQTRGVDGKSGYFEVHHVDDDHHNNHPDNLATVCPFCHSTKHFALAHIQDRGFFVPARGVSQRTLNRIMMVLWFETLVRDRDLEACRVDLKRWIEEGRKMMATAPAYRDLVDGAALGNRVQEMAAAGPGKAAALEGLRTRLKTVLLVPNLDNPLYQKATRYWSQTLSAAWTPARVARHIAGEGDQ